MNKALMVLALLALVGLVFVSGCTSGNASYDPPSGPVGGGCGVGAGVEEDPCAVDDSVETFSL
ncbi:hypothetical protein HY492_01000 [Candidatus Woesearchaeota archaeon]|nr:hypothetical protein [Candidatus Woesearchaeota archaeon]